MSEPKLISPMLDAYDMGGPISDHDGVKCCPAMRKNSDDKYIVKIISVPASQTKLDALLLTGAYPSKEAALVYFKELADGIVEEKKILDDLSRLEGFVAYDDCQIVPMDDATGYDVYLLSPYRMTLERKIAREPMTQLGAVNLGLDLCAALAICRQSGYMCVDIKPSNIVLSGDKEFCIGDLGFTSLSSLQYASLPDKYRSCYTAPEVEDAFSALSNTMDIYAVGMVLYQIYNGGKLPFTEKTPPKEVFSAPAFADEEIAQIILRACAPKPEDRWQDPVEMGQALVSYMQKNGANDTPLTAEFFGDEEAPKPEEVASEVAVSDVAEEPVSDEMTMEEQPVEDAAQEEMAEAAEAEFEDEEEPVPEVEDTEDSQEAEALPEEAEPEHLENNEEPAAEDDTEESVSTENDESYDNLSFLDNMDEEALEVNYDAVDADVSEMLDQIDELASHQIPEPPVAPDPIEVNLPDPPVQENEVDEAPTAEVAAQEAETEAEDEDSDLKPTEDASEELPEETPYVPKKKRIGLIWCIVLLIIVALGVGGYFFYTEYYLQPIHSLVLEGAEDRLQVQLTADIDESYLTVVCSDSHGNNIPAPVVGGTAVFTGLAPDTAYTVSVQVDGFHELTGVTSKVYSTPVQTKIAQISVVTGSESGSVILSFAIEGPDSDQWNVIYNAAGEAERVTAFPSHMVTLTGLTVGKEYTFRLEPVEEIYLSGEAEVSYVARELVCAENLHITACTGGILTAQWEAPDDSEVTEWSVRCYNESGYDETITTAENTVTFEGIDDTSGYTVDVTAAGMSVSQQVVVSSNSITVTDFTVDASRSDVLTLSWNANREIPAEGWTLRYSVNNVSAAQSITTNANTVQIPVVPNGYYVFTLLDGAGNAVLGGPFVHTQSDAAPFAGFSTEASNLTVRLCKTPSDSTWSYKDLSDDDYVNSFSVGQKISAVVSHSGSTTTSDDSVIITFAIYDEDENLVCFSHQTQTWRSMWYENYCELDVSSIPTGIGTYNLVMFFNGQLAGSQKFAITA